jgi:hypothetical protein
MIVYFLSWIILCDNQFWQRQSCVIFGGHNIWGKLSWVTLRDHYSGRFFELSILDSSKSRNLIEASIFEGSSLNLLKSSIFEGSSLNLLKSSYFEVSLPLNLLKSSYFNRISFSLIDNIKFLNSSFPLESLLI